MQLHMTAYGGNMALRKKYQQKLIWAFKKFLVNSDSNRDSIWIHTQQSQRYVKRCKWHEGSLGSKIY